MKVGILTFHWATNYGALLQAYCLQSYLENQGHSVEIVNFKPSQYDFSLLSFIKHPRSMLPNFWQELKRWKKNRVLDVFRRKYLHETNRFYSIDEVIRGTKQYDILISGSDQVLNPGFTTNGDNGPCPIYFLNFASKRQKKIGYAVSFGCENYPEGLALKLGQKWINSLDTIGIRETSGERVLSQLCYSGQVKLTPDPVILYGKETIGSLELPRYIKGQKYLYSYFLHDQALMIDKDVIGMKIVEENRFFSRSLEEWIAVIKYSACVVTNSYHGTILAILFHIPFAVVLTTNQLSGMNNRFFTLLSRLGLENHISDNDFASVEAVLRTQVDWDLIDKRIRKYSLIGRDFLTAI